MCAAIEASNPRERNHLSVRRRRTRAACSLAGVVFALGALSVAAHAGGGAPVVPAYIEKPVTWTNMLIDKDRTAVKDGEVATWWKQAQTNAAALTPARSFQLVATFTQCYGGGFLTELKNKGVANFGANSANKFFQAATYDSTNNRGHYSFAWQRLARLNVAMTDQWITANAYDSMINGANGVPMFTGAGKEEPQYLDNDANNATPPPVKLKNHPNHNYAILYSGFPNTDNDYDKNDMSNIYDTLRNVYGYAAANIYIMYGDFEAGVQPAGVAWMSDAKATKGNLRKAIRDPGGWLMTKLDGQPGGQTTAQVFFWVGDHGNVDVPVTITVTADSKGQAGTDLNVRSVGAMPVATVLFSAGGATNKDGFDMTGIAAGPINALSFGKDIDADVISDNPGDLSIYFSVDDASMGKANSDVNQEKIKPKREAKTDIFTITKDSNRQLIDGAISLGLVEDPPALVNADAVRALAMDDVLNRLDPAMPGCLRQPVFFSINGDSKIYVHDPSLVPPVTYVFLDFAWFGHVVPDVDGIALRTALKRGPVMPPDYPVPVPAGRLYFNPATDLLFFSTVADAALGFKGCEIYQFPFGGGGINMWRTCGDLGLLDADNVDALDIGSGVRFTAAPTPTPMSNPDVNGDGQVDFVDLSIVLGNYGVSGCSVSGDAVLDGIVDFADFSLVLAYYGQPAP